MAGVKAAYVHMGSRVAGESYGIYAKMGFGQNTIIFHANSQQARKLERYGAMHRWALDNHCDAGMPAQNATLRCEMSELTSCTGARWKRCLYVHNYTACPASGPRWRGEPGRNRTTTVDDGRLPRRLKKPVSDGGL